MVRNATKSEAGKVAAGGKRLPGGVISAEAAEAVEFLAMDGYAPSLTKAIERALIDARAAWEGKPAEPVLSVLSVDVAALGGTAVSERRIVGVFADAGAMASARANASKRYKDRAHFFSESRCKVNEAAES